MRSLSAVFAAISLSAIPQLSHAEVSGDYHYTDTGSSIRIDRYTNRAKTGTLVIPSTIAGKPVTVIGESAFELCSRITAVTIPAGVTTVETYAFEDCSSLASVQFPEGLTTLGEDAFSSCWKLKTVRLPSTLTTAAYAFGGSDSNLQNVTFAPGAAVIPEGVLNGCDSLTSVTIPTSVKRIGKHAFGYCEKLSTIKLPSGLTEIGAGAFEGCPISKISFPSSLTIIGDRAFRSTLLSRITFPPSLVRFGSYSFAGCKQLTTVIYTGEAPPLSFALFDGGSPDLTLFAEKGASGIPVPYWEKYRSSWPAPEITIKTLDGKSIQSKKTVNLGKNYVGRKAPFQKAIITNTGIRPLTGLRISSSSSDARHFIIKDLKKKSLAPGESIAVSVSYSPTKAGRHLGKFLIHSNDKDESSFVIYLSGRAYNRP